MWLPETQECVLHEPERNLLSSNSAVGDCFGGAGCPRTFVADATTLGVVRRQFPHFPRVALRTSLVQPMERKVVCRLFANDLSPAHPSMDRNCLQRCWSKNGLHVGATDWSVAPPGRRVSIRQDLGGRTVRLIRRPRYDFPPRTFIPGLSG